MTPRRRGQFRSEDGTVSILAAAAMAALLAATALAVDTGRLGFTSREIRSHADLTALDGVRALGDLRDPAIPVDVQADGLAHDALGRNAGFVEATSEVPSLDVTVGYWDPDSYTFTPTTAAPNAVQIIARGVLDYLLMPGGSDVVHEAIAVVRSIGGLSVGSTLASAEYDTSQAIVLNRILSRFLGGTVTLDAVGYRGLVTAAVPLGPLAAELGFGTVEALLDTDVQATRLLSATATVLSRTGDALDLDAVTPLATMSRSIDASRTVRLGRVLSVDVGSDDAVADAELNVRQLVIASAQVINGTNLADIDVPVTIPGVTSARATLSLIELPQSTIGPAWQDASGAWVTTARTAQGRFQLDLVLPGAITIPTGLLSSVTADLHVPLYVETASAAASLTDVRCSREATAATQTIHGSTTGAAAWLGSADTAGLASGAVAMSGSLAVRPAHLVDVADLISVTGTASSTVGGAARDLVFNGPFDHRNVQRISGGPLVGSDVADLAARLVDGLDVQVQVLDSSLLDPLSVAQTVQTEVTNRLTEVLHRLDADVVHRIVRELGYSVGDADIAAFHIDCGDRRLVR